MSRSNRSVIPGTSTPLRISAEEMSKSLDAANSPYAAFSDAIPELLCSVLSHLKSASAESHASLLKLLKPFLKRLQQRCDNDARSLLGDSTRMPLSKFLLLLLDDLQDPAMAIPMFRLLSGSSAKFCNNPDNVVNTIWPIILCSIPSSHFSSFAANSGLVSLVEFLAPVTPSLAAIASPLTDVELAAPIAAEFSSFLLLHAIRLHVDFGLEGVLSSVDWSFLSEPTLLPLHTFGWSSLPAAISSTMASLRLKESGMGSAPSSPFPIKNTLLSKSPFSVKPLNPFADHPAISAEEMSKSVDAAHSPYAAFFDAIPELLCSVFSQLKSANASSHASLLKLFKPFLKRLQLRCDQDARSLLGDSPLMPLSKFFSFAAV